MDIEYMVNWSDVPKNKLVGFVPGGVLYASAWVAIFSKSSTLQFYAWVVAEGVALGGLAGFGFVRERLITPLLFALFVLLLGLIPSYRGPDVPPSSPGELSLVFLFGWPVLLGLTGLLFRVETALRNRPV